MEQYKLAKGINGGPAPSVNRLSDGASIPFDPDNVDFQEYQRWLAEGNVPEEPQE